LSDLITEGISALKTGNKVRARNFLKLAIQENPKNIKAWLWLSGAVEDEDERMMCLLTVLKLEPENEAATRGLAEIMARRAVAEPTPAPRPEAVEIPAPEAAAGWASEAAVGTAVEAEAITDESAAEESAAALFQAPPFEPAVELAGERVEEPDVFESSLSTPASVEWFSAVTAPPQDEAAAPADAAASADAEEEPLMHVEAIQAPVEESTQEIPVGKRKEKIIFTLGPSWGYGFAVLVLLLVAMALIVLAALVYLPQWSMLVAAALAVLWVLIAAGQLLTAATYRYFLTNKHVVIDQGFISRKRIAIPLASLDDIQLRQDFFQKIFGVGDIALTQAGEPHTARLRNVSQPDARQDEIQTAWHPPSNENSSVS